MKEPIIEVVPETNTVVKDKNIIYSDEILPTENYVNQIMIKEVSGVCIYSLERCIKMILESNSDVVFYNIQYSKSEEIVYFYTNDNINIDYYLNRKKYKPLTLEHDLLIELKKLLENDQNKDNDCVSLCQVSNLIETKEAEYYSSLRKIYNSEFKEYSYTKLQLYDTFMEYSEFLNQCSNNIVPVNYNCLVDINKRGVSTFSPYSFSYSYMGFNSFICCASSEITDIIKGNEKKLLKNIYVEIGDCPKWSRPILYEIRQNELLEQEKIKEKKTKKLELRNKIFPFLKK